MRFSSFFVCASFLASTPLTLAFPHAPEHAHLHQRNAVEEPRSLPDLSAWAQYLAYLFAQIPVPQATTRPAETHCHTILGSKAPFGRPTTAYSTKTTSCKAISTSVAVAMVGTTLPPSVTTSTATVISTITMNNPTVTSTSVIASTTTCAADPSIVTSVTISVVSTTTTAVVTVSTMAGFVPVGTSVPNSSLAVQRRGLSLSDLIKLFTSPNVVRVFGGNFKYPQNVKCTVSQASCAVGTTTITSTFTSTITPNPSTVITTTTLTTTVNPTATVTSTVKTTSISTVLTTPVSTVTSTATYSDVATITSSYYAACASNNLVNRYKGQIIAGANAPDNNFKQVYATDDDDIYSCCVTAMKDPLAIIFGFGSGQCSIAQRDTCIPVDQSAQWAVVTGSSAYDQFTLGNAYCGQAVGL